MKRDIYIHALNYYEVKKWAAKEKEAELTYIAVVNKCKEYEATVRDYIAMANDNSQLQTVYQQGTASLDHKKQKFTGRGRRNRSNSGSRERRPQNKPNATKCKRCGFEHHTPTDGSCPALKSTCGFCKIVGHYESACIKKCTEKKREGTDKRGKQTHSQTEAKEHKHQDQEAEELQCMQSEQQINLDMILTAFTLTLSVQSTQHLQKSILTF